MQIFFEPDVVEFIHSLESEQLANINDEIHCTFKYHPKEEEIFDDLVGKSFEVFLIGYGNDGLNSGFQIALPRELMPYYINYDEQHPEVLKIPHITTSLAEGAKPANTKNLEFKPFKKPIRIVGKFGYWIKNNEEEYLSYIPYSKNKVI